MNWVPNGWQPDEWQPDGWQSDDSVIAALTGTALSALTEQAIVDGGRTIIITLTNDTWVAAGATFNAQRQNIIDGLVSAQSEANGFNAERSNIAVTAVVRTSDTVVTITLPALADFDIVASETITATVPASALTGGEAVVASPTIRITALASLAHKSPALRHNDTTLRHESISMRHHNQELRHNG